MLAPDRSTQLRGGDVVVTSRSLIGVLFVVSLFDGGGWVMHVFEEGIVRC